MAATTFGAIKAYIESKGLGISVYKDAPPSGVVDQTTGRINAPGAYCTVIEDIGLKMDPLEDGGPAQGAEATVVELVQLDLWQNWKAVDGTLSESPTLPDAITRAIHGTRLLSSGTGAPPKTVYHVAQQGRIRMLDRDSKLVHHAYTLAINRVV